MLNNIFLELLNWFASFLGGNYGLAIIAVTLAIRTALLPLILPSLKSNKKMQELKPELDKLKKKFGHDKQLFSKKQLELYQSHNINPLSGCLPQIVQLILFIAFYQVLNSTLKNGQSDFSFNFLWLNLHEPDKTLILPILTAASQLLLGVMIMPAADTTAEKELALKTKTNKDDKEAVDMDQMAKTMQSQMLFMMPLITGFIAVKFPSGLALYWITSTLYSLVQQYFVSGWGGLVKYSNKLKKVFK